MTHSKSCSEYFGSGNGRIYLNGQENVSDIRNSEHCLLFADKSKLRIRQSSLVKVETTESALSLDVGKKARIIGDQNAIHGADFCDFLLHSSSSTVATQNTENLIWSGAQGKCQLMDSRNLSVYGKENQIIGRGNTNMLICGHDNLLVANQNENLKVRGHTNQVVATRTCSLSVEGNMNAVSAMDISIRHVFTKAEPGFVTGFSFSIYPENQMEFCAILTDCSIYTGILCPPTPECLEMPVVLVNSASAYSKPKRIDEKFFKAKNPTSNMSYAIMPQVRISYVDQALINKNSYKLGIFHICVDGMSDLHNQHSPLKVKVITDELDPASSFFRISACKRNVMIVGRKNGKQENLRIMGNRITVNDDDSFSVHFEVIEDEVDNETRYEEYSVDVDTID